MTFVSAGSTEPTNARLLLVERSTAMRRVLGEHLSARGHDVDNTSSYAEAISRLDRRFDAFRGDYAGVVLGWPAAHDTAIDALLARLEQDDLVDLPVVVMSTDLRPATRAWVASRTRTRVIAWKHYRDIDAALDALPVADAAPPTNRAGDRAAIGSSMGDRPGGGVLVSSSTNLPASDTRAIQLLVVDDSATIRRSLEDLFTPQGYGVSLAAGQRDALEIARSKPIDVAIVDFYLEYGTGDDIVRELAAHAETSDIISTVLTGTYSDHIIRRSLRAGALECLFKNESSELLLNRVAALSRFVVQRRRLADERQLLDRVFNVVAGPALVLDSQGSVRHVSNEALVLLGHDGSEALMQRPVLEMIGLVALPPIDGERHRSRVRRADGSRIEALVAHRRLDADMGSVLQFAPADAPQTRKRQTVVAELEPPATVEPSRADGSPAASLPLAPPADRFIALLDRCLAGEEQVVAQASLLVVGVWLPRPGDSAEPLRDHADRVARLTPIVTALYRRADHVASLGDGRYAFLLRHADEQQAWLLTRKLMQSINAAMKGSGERLATCGVLKPIGNERVDAQHLLEHCLGVLERVEARGLDHALLLGPRRMLGVYAQAPG